ncbi:glycosyltransferase, partial [Lederbergia wuyishanensis]
AKNYGIPNRIVHGHNIRQGGSSLHKYIHGINQFLIETYATDYFACSEPSARWTFPKRILERKEYGVINNAIESERFKFNEQIRNKIRKELGIEDKFVIGHIGRFHPQKNHTYLIDIFKQIHIKSGESVLLLVGDGNLRPDIERRIQELGLTDSVIFTGIRKDVAEILQAMDIFLFPSLYEGLGIVLVEAQATGLKCFTSNKVVPESVNVTGLVEFIDLEKSPEHWAGEIFRKKDYQRKNTINDIKKSGYDITQVANEIQVWYESKINNTILLDNRKL